MNDNVRLVVATKETREGFFKNTATGKSLALYDFPFVELTLFPQNRLGLPVVYNKAIDAARKDPATLVFIHDDVHLCDYFWVRQLYKGLEKFQIIGLAGNKRRVPNQPGWPFIDTQFTWDSHENLSGVVGHGKGFPPESVIFYGEIGEQVKLLDGVLIACRSETLHENQLRFDEDFLFHFYDMDFCRQAEAKGVSMGTFDTSIVHESSGRFGTPMWTSGYHKYLKKWGS
jgi:hypothetical protein